MTRRLEVYKCRVCGNMVEVLHEGQGELVCCGQPMELLREREKDEGLEKHVPVIEKTGKGVKVRVGSVPHPMEEKHYIEWIELVADGRAYRQFLRPGDAPEAEFEVDAGDIRAREHCNVHGLWRSGQARPIQHGSGSALSTAGQLRTSSMSNSPSSGRTSR